MEEKIIKILELVQMKEEGIVEFTAESKALIHEAAEECRKLPLYQDNKDKEETYKEGLTAGQVYADMCFKIINAPTPFHMMAVPKMMLPVIDDKLQEDDLVSFAGKNISSVIEAWNKHCREAER